MTGRAGRVPNTAAARAVCTPTPTLKGSPYMCVVERRVCAVRGTQLTTYFARRRHQLPLFPGLIYIVLKPGVSATLSAAVKVAICRDAVHAIRFQNAAIFLHVGSNHVGSNLDILHKNQPMSSHAIFAVFRDIYIVLRRCQAKV